MSIALALELELELDRVDPFPKSLGRLAIHAIAPPTLTMAALSKTFWRCSSSSAIFRTVSRVKRTSEDLTGHSSVLQAQQMVRTRKEELRQSRQKLSEATDSYEQVQRRLKGLYARKSQVYQDQRRDLSAIQAVNDEEESLLLLEQSYFTDLENCQQKERECFEMLSDAIQESHERERAKSDQMKYYSRLGSLMGAVFGFLGSNLFLRREIRQHNVHQAEKMETIESTLLRLQKQETLENQDISHTQQIASSSQGSQEIISFARKNGQTLSQTQAKMEELNTNVKRNNLILEKICTHLRLQLPCEATVLTDTAQNEVGQPRSSNQEAQSLNDMVALGGVVAYSVLLALFSLYR